MTLYLVFPPDLQPYSYPSYLATIRHVSFSEKASKTHVGMSSTDLELAIIRQVVVSYDFINHIFRFRGKVGFRTVALPSHFFLLNRSTDKESARSIKRYELEYCVYNENNILLPMYICTVCSYIPTCVKDLLST